MQPVAVLPVTDTAWSAAVLFDRACACFCGGAFGIIHEAAGTRSTVFRHIVACGASFTLHPCPLTSAHTSAASRRVASHRHRVVAAVLFDRARACLCGGAFGIIHEAAGTGSTVFRQIVECGAGSTLHPCPLTSASANAASRRVASHRHRVVAAVLFDRACACFCGGAFGIIHEAAGTGSTVFRQIVECGAGSTLHPCPLTSASANAASRRVASHRHRVVAAVLFDRACACFCGGAFGIIHEAAGTRSTVFRHIVACGASFTLHPCPLTSAHTNAASRRVASHTLRVVVAVLFDRARACLCGGALGIIDEAWLAHCAVFVGVDCIRTLTTLRPSPLISASAYAASRRVASHTLRVVVAVLFDRARACLCGGALGIVDEAWLAHCAVFVGVDCIGTLTTLRPSPLISAQYICSQSPCCQSHAPRGCCSPFRPCTPVEQMLFAQRVSSVAVRSRVLHCSVRLAVSFDSLSTLKFLG